MFIVSMHPTGRILDTSGLDGVGYPIRELQLIVALHEQNEHPTKGLTKLSTQSPFASTAYAFLLRNEQNAFMIDEKDSTGNVPQKAWEAIFMALGRNVAYKEQRRSSNNPMFSKAVEQFLEFKLMLEENLVLIGTDDPYSPPRLPWEASKATALVQFYQIPEFSDSLIIRYLRRALEGELYEQKTPIYSPKTIDDIMQPMWQQDTNYIHAYVDQSLKVHSLNQSDQHDEALDGNMLIQLSRREFDALYFGRGLILPIGGYKTLNGEVSLLISPTKITLCQECKEDIMDGRYPTKTNVMQ